MNPLWNETQFADYWKDRFKQEPTQEQWELFDMRALLRW